MVRTLQFSGKHAFGLLLNYGKGRFGQGRMQQVIGDKPDAGIEIISSHLEGKSRSDRGVCADIVQGFSQGVTNKMLVVDDEEGMLSLVERIVTGQREYVVLKAVSANEALDILSTHDVGVVLADVRMPGVDGLQLLERIRETRPETTVIMMTAFGSIGNAVDAMKKGAYDYITKPFQYDDLLLAVDRAFERVRLLDDRLYLQTELQKCFGFSELIGNSVEMMRVYGTIRDVAGTSAPVLITGESGTGKELAARAIHFESRRKDRRFVTINCAVLPENILESELFGHMRGSFTGAVRDKRGLLEEADGGTLFLDEVAELSPQIQVKLLRVLQDGGFRSIGDVNDKKADLRIISATNKKLEHEIAKGNFREDLYYRLNVISLTMPALRERREDIPVLAGYFLRKYANKYEKEVTDISTSAMWYVINRPWKGNVRELEN
ncbi:MAG: sigma-54-dependent Fis family transcriptional regulator, partial [Nitrospirae bacterium]|nr:sigma-54-dependent Fis family transcriptional regulator [Nitrospirota bacterium]